MGQIMVLIYTAYLVLYFYICLQKQIKNWQLITAGAFSVLILLVVINLPRGQIWQAFSNGYVFIGLGILLISFVSQRLTRSRKKKKALVNPHLPIALSLLVTFVLLAMTYPEIVRYPSCGKGCEYYFNPVFATVLITFIPLGIVVYFFHKKIKH
jgi:membrane protease YdiL (CAAX protease family)